MTPDKTGGKLSRKWPLTTQQENTAFSIPEMLLKQGNNKTEPANNIRIFFLFPLFLFYIMSDKLTSMTTNAKIICSCF